MTNPSVSQLHREKNGSVKIYHELKDTTVENVMDTQFHRLNSMMFTGTIVTNQNGETQINPETGQIETEEDGCD